MTDSDSRRFWVVEEATGEEPSPEEIERLKEFLMGKPNDPPWFPFNYRGSKH